MLAACRTSRVEGLGMHVHEPDPETYMAINDLSPARGADLLDPDVYPLIARCEDCRQLIRCDAVNASWGTASERAGVSGFPTPADVKHGSDLRIVRRVIADDTEALDLLDQALEGRQGERTDIVNNINDVRPPNGHVWCRRCCQHIRSECSNH
jgi:hypothetical protein